MVSSGELVRIMVCGWMQFAGVSITGGLDDTGQWYLWTVRNERTSPVVSVRFPHYHADLFNAPQGWRTRSTHLVNVGEADAPGECEALAQSPDQGIGSGAGAEFKMRMAAKGAARGKGQVVVTFADGGSAVVEGVEVPVPPSPAETFLPLAGLAAVIVVVGVWRARRRRPCDAGQDGEAPTSLS